MLDLSNHEKRQLALAKQIAELESKAIGPKEWTLLGEASSKSRPENSLLEENLDFEHAGKVVPVITEETVKTLEEMIKARIIDVSHQISWREEADVVRTTSTRLFALELMNPHLSFLPDTLNCKTLNPRNHLHKYMKKSINPLPPEPRLRILEMRS